MKRVTAEKEEDPLGQHHIAPRVPLDCNWDQPSPQVVAKAPDSDLENGRILRETGQIRHLLCSVLHPFEQKQHRAP